MNIVIFALVTCSVGAISNLRAGAKSKVLTTLKEDIGKREEPEMKPAPDENIGEWQDGRDIGKETEDKIIPVPDDMKPAPDENIGEWQDGRDIGKQTEDKMIPDPNDESIGFDA